MIQGKFFAHDDFDLAGHRLLNWKWVQDIPVGNSSEGQVIANIDGEATWSTLTASGIVSVAWDDITGKPLVYPPEDHTHPWNEVTGKPTFVNSFMAGLGLQTTAATGDITVALSDNVEDALRFFVGATLQSLTVDVTSDGADITLAVSAAVSTVVLVFQDTRYDYDVSGTPSITLTAGTDTVPVLNYIWIPSDTKVLTVGLDWPTGIDYVPIATVLCQSAASAQTYGLYKVHVWTDHTHTDDSTGHLAHLNSWIRTQPATWRSGVVISPSLGADEFDIALTAGIILQLHDHAFPTMTSVAGSEPIYVYNDSVTPFKRVADMADELTDADGDTLSNRYYNLVVWGVVSEDAADCKMIVNLPTGSYSNATTAQADSSATAVYGIPVDYAGTGFLIARIVAKHAPAGNTFTLVETIDLRGTFPGGFSGSSAGSGDHGGLIGLSDPDHPLTALQQSGATTGQVVEWNGSTWVPEAIVNSVTAGTNVVVSATNGADIGIATVTNPSFGGTLHVVGAVDFDSTINVDGGGTIDGSLQVGGSVRIRYIGGGDGFLYFYDDGSPTGEYLKWDDGDDRFEFSNDLSVGASINAVSYKVSGTTLSTTHLDDTANLKLSSIQFVIKDSATLTTGTYGPLLIPFDGDLTEGWLLAGAANGSIAVDVWSVTYGSHAATNGDSISGGSELEISGDIKSKNTTLTAWTKPVSAGDLLYFNIDSCVTLTELTIVLLATKDLS